MEFCQSEKVGTLQSMLGYTHPPPRRPLQRTLRILLECFLVETVFVQMSFFSSLQPESFAVITQDLGRMCRYVKQGEIVPNALLGSGLYEILKENLRNQAVFHGLFIMPSNDSGHVHGPKGITIRYVARALGDFNLSV